MAELGTGSDDRIAIILLNPCGTTTGSRGRESGVERGRALMPAVVVGWRRLRLGALVYVGHDGQANPCPWALRLIEAKRDTVLHGVPMMFHLLMRETTFNPSRLRTLRGGTIAGGSVSEALVDRVRGWGDVDVAVRGPNVMPGCARMPAENRRSCKPDAFYLTGDHGIIDEAGNAAVDDVCVIGVPQEILGEPVCACIAPVEGVVITGEEVKDIRPPHGCRVHTPSS